jgi:hypothetical protein
VVVTAVAVTGRGREEPQSYYGRGRDEAFHKFQLITRLVCPVMRHGTCEMVALANYGQAVTDDLP